MTEITDYKKARQITIEVKQFVRQLIKPGMKLLEIAEKIEAKMIELGAKPAFPVNLGINEIAAHYTPAFNDDKIAQGLLKVDFGIRFKENIITDTAFTLDLTKEKKFTKLIEASEKALENADRLMKRGTKLNEIGKTIQETITSYGFSPIRNLCGHQIKDHNLHAGLTIPNYDNGNEKTLDEGTYAVEPFATTGTGIVQDARPSGIFKFESRKGVRDPIARRIMDFIEQEYQTLPFCERWIIKKFGERAIFSLKQLEQAGVISQFHTLVEKSSAPVSQAENTYMIHGNSVMVLSD
jgi:methionyl aminopeptidase